MVAASLSLEGMSVRALCSSRTAAARALRRAGGGAGVPSAGAGRAPGGVRTTAGFGLAGALRAVRRRMGGRAAAMTWPPAGEAGELASFAGGCFVRSSRERTRTSARDAPAAG